MNKKIKIGILGGDLRQVALATHFSLDGVECAVWGIENLKLDSLQGNIVRTLDWKSSISGTKAVILPLPITTDGIRLNCTKSIYNTALYIPRISEILEIADKDTLIFGGKIPATYLRLAAERKLKIIDYYESEEFQIKNAVPTAEGAISIAIQEMNITLCGCNVGIFGYGRIGRTLALRLISLGCKVTCIARSKKDIAWAECDGCTTIKLSNYKESSTKFDVIFNTVPHIIFDHDTLSRLPNNQLLIDLASLNGGVDTESAEKLGIKVIKALSLPGKFSPITAGKIIYDSIKETLEEEEIL